MTLTEIAKHRLTNQQLGKRAIDTIAGIAGWMGAMQAQDYAMARWAIGIRLPGSTDIQVEQAINEAAIIRTHILRPTWHFVSAADIHWMLALSAPHVKAKAAASNRQLGLDNAVLHRCNIIIRKCLEGGKQLTRPELMVELKRSGITTDDNRSAHIMFMAALDALVCNGARRGKQFTYALLDERVPAGKILPREEALALLAERYFTSRGPATIRDFAWWSGLPVTDIKASLAAHPALMSENYDGQTYWRAAASPSAPAASGSVHLLPAFDEFMISYQDRNATLDPAFTRDTIGINGLFKPIIVLNGKVAGTWKRSVKKDTVRIELNPYKELSRSAKEGISAAANRYSRFLGLKVVISSSWYQDEY